MLLRMMSPAHPWWSCLVVFMGSVLVFSPSHVDGIAVMSIDLGTEWMKVAIVSPGVPMEIALNKESKRKTPVAVAFRDDERFFGEDALNVGVRFPHLSYHYLLELLGKPTDHFHVKLFRKRFPYYDIVPEPYRKTVLFQHDNSNNYTPEELLSMILQKAKEYAQNSANQPVNEAVITVPGYFGQAERSAVLQAAKLANIKVLQLMSDYAAVALNYGIFRLKNFNETAHYVMFYDMGASSSTATIVSYQQVEVKNKGVTEKYPLVQVIGIGYDRTLGGLEMTFRLRDHLAKKFNEMKKTPNDVFENHRAMAKLLKEAGRVKTILSANTEHYAQVEGLLDEKDFKLKVTREEFEKMCADMAPRVKGPVEQALKTANLPLDVISNVVLVGAGTRVPFVQEELTKAVKMELSKNLNTDEAAVLGAVYKAADLSTGFKVKKFLTRDAVLYPIEIFFNKGPEGDQRQFKRLLFGPMNPYPTKKILTFNKYYTDFTFYVKYGEFGHILPEELQSIGKFNLYYIQIKGVEEAFAKYKGDNSVEPKGIKVHFSLDESGILSLNGADLVLEKTVSAEDEESPLSKLGSTISKLFTGPEEALKNTGENTVEDDGNAKEGESVEQKEDGDGDQQKGGSSPGEGTAEEVKKNETAKDSDKKKQKVKIIKEPLIASDRFVGVIPVPDWQLEEFAAKIKELDDKDEMRRKREGALNALESFLFDVKIKMEEDPYITAATEAEAEAIRETCSKISDWLDEEGFNADFAAYEAKLLELKNVTRPVWIRVKEHEERPEALAAFEATLNGSIQFLDRIKNLTANATADGSLFTPVEIQVLEKTINETKDWKKKVTEEQSQLKLSENPKITIRALVDKMHILDREVKYLANKVWRPAVKDGPAGKDSAGGNDTSKKQKPPSTDDKKTDDDVPNFDEFRKPIKVNFQKKSETDTKKEESTKEKSSKDDSDDGMTEEEMPSLPEPDVESQAEPSKKDQEPAPAHSEL